LVGFFALPTQKFNTFVLNIFQKGDAENKLSDSRVDARMMKFCRPKSERQTPSLTTEHEQLNKK
jgi:hypothetical protein